jgi:hypothetical protein
VFFKAWIFSSLMAQGPGEARHDIAAAPGATTGSVLRFILKLRADGAVHPPKPRKPLPRLRFIRISFFPRLPQNTKPQLGLRTASGEWFSGGLGLRVKDLHEPGTKSPKSPAAKCRRPVSPVTVYTGGLPCKQQHTPG